MPNKDLVRDSRTKNAIYIYIYIVVTGILDDDGVKINFYSKLTAGSPENHLFEQVKLRQVWPNIK